MFSRNCKATRICSISRSDDNGEASGQEYPYHGGNSGIGWPQRRKFDREGARVRHLCLNERTLQATKRGSEPEVSPFARTSAISPTSTPMFATIRREFGTWTASS